MWLIMVLGAFGIGGGTDSEKWVETYKMVGGGVSVCVNRSPKLIYKSKLSPSHTTAQVGCQVQITRTRNVNIQHGAAGGLGLQEISMYGFIMRDWFNDLCGAGV